MAERAIRIGDTVIPAVGRGCLIVELGDDGDAFVQVSGIRPDSKGSDHPQGESQCARIEFCMPRGGGYHPKTIQALRNLAKAIKADNEDSKNPERYKGFVHERG